MLDSLSDYVSVARRKTDTGKKKTEIEEGTQVCYR
jgi:hypothetical protein